MIIPPGIFNTRANLLVDIVTLINTLAPFIMFYSFKRARRRNFPAHKRAQLWLLAICFSAVMALEFNIRMAGGTLISGTYTDTVIFRWVLGLHITGAVLTYILWAYLAWKSIREFNINLPGRYSKTHKTTGMIVFYGMIFNVISALAVYILGFVL